MAASQRILLAQGISFGYIEVIYVIKFDGYTEADVIYNFMGSKFDGCIEANATIFIGTKFDGYAEADVIYNFVGTKFDGYAESSVIV